MTFVPHAPGPPQVPQIRTFYSSSHDRRIVPTVVHSSSTRERARRQFCFELVVKTMTQWFTLLDGEACWGSAQLSDLPDELVHGYLVADTHSLCLSCSRIPLHAQCPRPRIFSCRSSYLLSDLARTLLLVNLFYSSLSGACDLLASSSIAAQGLQFL